jgi:hypothetical protein
MLYVYSVPLCRAKAEVYAEWDLLCFMEAPSEVEEPDSVSQFRFGA